MKETPVLLPILIAHKSFARLLISFSSSAFFVECCYAAPLHSSRLSAKARVRKFLHQDLVIPCSQVTPKNPGSTRSWGISRGLRYRAFYPRSQGELSPLPPKLNTPNRRRMGTPSSSLKRCPLRIPSLQ